MQCSPWCRKKKNLQVLSLLSYMDLELLHITHDSQLWAGCRRELALCCVLLWPVSVKMWYRSFSKHSWLEKSGHSGGKVNKISPSVPESWCECEWQRQPAAVRARWQRWFPNTAKLVEFPFVRNSFHPLPFFPRYSNTESTKRAANLTNNKVTECFLSPGSALTATYLLHVTLPYE